jgi:hypothetical protein
MFQGSRIPRSEVMIVRPTAAGIDVTLSNRATPAVLIAGTRQAGCKAFSATITELQAAGARSLRAIAVGSRTRFY